MISASFSRVCLVSSITALVTTGAGCSKETPKPAVDTPATDVAAAPAAPDVAVVPAGDVAEPSNPAKAAPDVAAEPAQERCEAPDVRRMVDALKPDFATSAEGVVSVCGGIGGESRGCLVHTPVSDPTRLKDGALYTLSAVALADDDVDHIPAYPVGFDDGFRREEGRQLTKICIDPAKGCKDLFIGNTSAGHFDSGRTRAALTTLEDDGSKAVRVFATDSREEKFSIPLPGSTLLDCSFGAFAGANIVVASGPCNSKEPGTAWLVNGETGDKIADIGGRPGFSLRDGHFTQVADGKWAFRSADGASVVVVDVATGAVVNTVSTGLEAGQEGRERAWVFDHGDNRVVLVEAGGKGGVEIVMLDVVAASVLGRFAPAPACR